MIVDCAHYRDGQRQQDGPMRPEDAAAICGRDPGFVWLGMVDPSPEELGRLQQVFGLHELAVEDAQSFHLRPKVEQYDEGIAFVVLRTARYVPEREEVDFGEISIFLGASFVSRSARAPRATCTRRGCGSRRARSCCGRARRRRCGRSSTRSWTTTPRSSLALERDIEDVERLVFSGAVAPVQRIYHLRREVSDFYRAVHPLLAPVSGLARGSLLDPSPAVAQYFRDVHDHLALVNEEVIAQRDLLSTVLQANMAVIGVEQSAIVRRISGWAAIITVPTFIASFYGMNFEHMPELRWEGSYPLVIALMVVTAFLLHRGFKRAGWL